MSTSFSWARWRRVNHTIWCAQNLQHGFKHYNVCDRTSGCERWFWQSIYGGINLRRPHFHLIKKYPHMNTTVTSNQRLQTPLVNKRKVKTNQGCSIHCCVPVVQHMQATPHTPHLVLPDWTAESTQVPPLWVEIVWPSLVPAETPPSSTENSLKGFQL